MTTLLRRIAGAALTAALVFAFPVTAAAAGTSTSAPPAAAAAATADGFQTGQLTDAAPPAAEKSANLKVPAWTYHITSSCSGYEGSIRQGANFWGNGTQTASSGTPVSCVSGYVQGCGGSNVVGCNWGMGDRITLSTMVNDFALLAAHEFGHNWYGHSASGCASWASAYDVMKTTMC